jgi:hypothetical protein
LEHLAITGDKNKLMRLVLDWLTVPEVTDSCPACLKTKGDMNGDGSYTSADAVAMNSCAYSGTGDCDLCFSDVNCDGNLTSADAVAELNRVFLGQTDPPWCGL